MAADSLNNFLDIIASTYDPSDNPESATLGACADLILASLRAQQDGLAPTPPAELVQHVREQLMGRLNAVIECVRAGTCKRGVEAQYLR